MRCSSQSEIDASLIIQNKVTCYLTNYFEQFHHFSFSPSPERALLPEIQNKLNEFHYLQAAAKEIIMKPTTSSTFCVSTDTPLAEFTPTPDH